MVDEYWIFSGKEEFFKYNLIIVFEWLMVKKF